MNLSIVKIRVKKEVNLIMIALAFFTRIPVSDAVDFSQKKLNHASRYFSLIGWLVGLICVIVFLLASTILPANIAIIISMLASVLLTGCFHEDGLADTCDGFGGGWDKLQKLKIMKDSRLGTYGAVALWLVLFLKYSLLVQTDSIVIALLVAHPLSRSISTSMIFFLPYVMDEQQSKIKPLAEKQHGSDFLISLGIGLLSLILVHHYFVYVVISLVVCFVFLRWLFFRQIGGFTGDTLGATQQVSELLIYTVIVANGSSV